MKDKTGASSEDRVFVNRAVEAAIRIGLVALLVFFCFLIVKVFIPPVLWGVIIAIGLFPLHLKLARALGQREGLAAVVLTLCAFALLVLPIMLISGSAIDGFHSLSAGLKEGTLKVPPPSEKVAGWPVIGKPLYDFWTLAAVNIGAALTKLEPYLKSYGPKVLSAGAGVAFAVLESIIAIIIAGVFLSNAAAGKRVVLAIFTRLAGDKGEEFTELSRATVQSVVQGVLGVAFIQAVLAGIGLFAVGIPAAGLWALAVLFLAVVQLPPLLVLGPIIFYVFSVRETTPAVVFTVWSILVSMSDSFLKPLFLGRGVKVPMLVILLGAIGGMMAYGIIGLFVGPVFLAIGYTLFLAWVQGESEATLPPGPGETAVGAWPEE